MEAVIEHRGRWYLPYQAHATESQFHRAYPRAKELFALKKKLDLKMDTEKVERAAGRVYRIGNYGLAKEPAP